MLSRQLENFIVRNNPEKQPLSAFLKRLPKMEKRKRFRFMDILFKEKLFMNENAVAFCKAFENKSDFIGWYYAYLDLYAAWFKEQVKKKDILKCLEIIPSLTPWFFEKKCPQKEIGAVPACLGKKENFLTLLDRILESESINNYKKIKDLEITAPTEILSSKQKKGQKVDDLIEKTKVLKKLLKEKMEHSFKITVVGKTFTIQPLFNPLSNKVVLRIVSPDKKKFILKISHTNEKIILNDTQRKNHENQLIRADSPYSNAVIDFYLKQNGCPMGTNVLYYNFVYDAVLYEEVDGKTYHFPDKKHIYRNVLEFNRHVATPLSRLGIYINDLREENFRIDKKTGDLKLIDAGHITYAQLLNPGMPEYTFTLGNLCGRDCVSHLGALQAWTE